MDQVMVVRHRVLVEGASRREVAEAMEISRNTVNSYLGGAVPGARKPSRRGRPTLDAARSRMDALLAESPRWTGGKQRLTARRLHRMLREEGIKVGETLVKQYVRERKRRAAEVFVPLVYKPGDLGEVDFFEVLVDVAGKRIKAWMFLLRAMFSGRDFAWLFPRQDQTCFLEGHVRAFEHLGGVQHRLAYDYLKPAVSKILVGSERVLTVPFVALANHYLFEASFCRPATGHDKGGVEARGKGIRLQQLVPIPAGESLEAISRALLARLDRQAADERDREGRSVMDRFSDEKELMLPLPAMGFRAAQTRPEVTVSRSAVVNIEGAKYSVWSTWNRLTVTAYIGVHDVERVGPDSRRVKHPRMRFGQRSIDYRHYLPELGRKPQALRQVADELVEALGPTYSVRGATSSTSTAQSRRPECSPRSLERLRRSAPLPPRRRSRLRSRVANRCSWHSGHRHRHRVECSPRRRSPPACAASQSRRHEPQTSTRSWEVRHESGCRGRRADQSWRAESEDAGLAPSLRDARSRGAGLEVDARGILVRSARRGAELAIRFGGAAPNLGGAISGAENTGRFRLHRRRRN